MIIADACKILNLTSPFSLRELKKAYYNEALKNHPDKNPDNPDSTVRFQSILEAYEFLSSYVDNAEDNATKQDISYEGILRNFIYYAGGDKSAKIESILHMITQKCSAFSKNILKSLDKKTLLTIYDYMTKYSDVIDINPEILKTLKGLVHDKINKDTVYILNPTIYDLFDKTVYKLESSKTYYVPLWHEEIEFDAKEEENGSIIVKCVPELPEHIYVDHHNNININISVCLSGLLLRDSISVDAGDKVFHIPVKKLFIRPIQSYVCRQVGIPRINSGDIYNCEEIGDVVIHIALT